MTRTTQKGHSETADPHWIEWLTGLVSAVIVLAMISWVGYAALSQTDESPDLRIEILETLKGVGGYQVRFSVANAASVTAAAVTIHGDLRDAGRVIDSADVTFDYVPANSAVSGALIFRTDPDGMDLNIRPTGYTDP